MRSRSLTPSDSTMKNRTGVWVDATNRRVGDGRPRIPALPFPRKLAAVLGGGRSGDAEKQDQGACSDLHGALHGGKCTTRQADWRFEFRP